MSTPRPVAPAAAPPSARWQSGRPLDRPTSDLILLAVAVAVLAASALLSVRGSTQVVLPLVHWSLPGTCSFRQMFGVGCPGCGLTRCFISVAHGELAAAWRFSPLGLVVFGLVAAQLPYRSWRVWRFLRGLPLPTFSSRRTYGMLALWLVVLLLLVLQWIVRYQAGALP